MAHKRMTYLRGLANGLKLYNTLKATNIAEKLHSGQFRKSGEPYVEHPMNVALLLADLQIIDDILLASALLHDVIEDCNVTVQTLINEYGVIEKVATNVQLLSQDKNMSNETFFSQIRTNPHCILIKLADRCHNVSTMMGVVSVDNMKKKYIETRDYIYPLYQYGKKFYPEYSSQLRLMKMQIETLMVAMKAYIRVYDKEFDLDKKVEQKNINTIDLAM